MNPLYNKPPMGQSQSMKKLFKKKTSLRSEQKGMSSNQSAAAAEFYGMTENAKQELNKSTENPPFTQSNNPTSVNNSQKESSIVASEKT